MLDIYAKKRHIRKYIDIYKEDRSKYKKWLHYIDVYVEEYEVSTEEPIEVYNNLEDKKTTKIPLPEIELTWDDFDDFPLT